MPIIEQIPISDAWIIHRRAHDQTTKHHPLVKSWPLTQNPIIFFWGSLKDSTKNIVNVFGHGCDL
jgi:hypothetical protein